MFYYGIRKEIAFDEFFFKNCAFTLAGAKGKASFGGKTLADSDPNFALISVNQFEALDGNRFQRKLIVLSEGSI